MGKVVKHVTSALTGKSGGGETKTKSTETASSNTASKSWLESNPQYQQLQNAALAEANNFQMPEQQMAAENPNVQNALAALASGTDASPYGQAANYFRQQGQTDYEQGRQTLSGARDTLTRIGGYSQADLQGMIQSEYDSDLVRDQISGATEDIQEAYQQQVLDLNHRAITSGAMGNSRAGVAQGVMAGKAQRAVGAASVQYRTAEESAATNRLMGYLNLQSSTAGQLAGIGQNQVQSGLGMYNSGMNYLSQYNQVNTQNAQNRLTAGNMQRQLEQERLNQEYRNQILRQSPALARLSMYNQQFLPMANLASTGTNSGTSTSNGVNITPGQGGNLLGGIMGMAGSAAGTYFGGATGGSIGGMFGSSFGNTFGH